jgi:hypothetical protein
MLGGWIGRVARAGAVVGLVVALAHGCRSGSGSSTATVTIGPGGGTVTSADGVVTLVVPAGAVAADVAISIVPAPATPPGAVSGAYDLAPDGTSFLLPAQLTFRLPASALGGATPDQLEIGTAVAGAWQPAAPSLVDVASGSVSVLTTHLSRWAVVPAASNPCACHTTDWNACCTQRHGAFAVSGGVCTCTGYDGDFDDFLACYTVRVGGERVTNYCSACLRSCCTSRGGTVTRSCDCEVNAPGWGSATVPPPAIDAVVACSLGCFKSKDDATICAAPGTIGPPQGDGGPGDGGPGDGGAGDDGGAPDDAGGLDATLPLDSSSVDDATVQDVAKADAPGGDATVGLDASGADASGIGDATSGGDADAAGDPWVSTWSCTQTDHWTYTAPAGQASNDTTESSTRTVVRNADGSYTIPLGCPVLFTLSGNVATLESGQSCPVSFGGTSITESYTSATATLAGDTVTANIAYTFSGTETVDGSVVATAGSATTTASCTRTDAGPCGPGNCNGCCDATGTCQGGTTSAACGQNGGSCAACATDRCCITATGAGNGPGTCDGYRSCPGCCSNDPNYPCGGGSCTVPNCFVTCPAP